MVGTGQAGAAYAAYLTNDNGQISIYQTLYTFTQENIQHGKYGMKPSLVIRTTNQLYWGQKEVKQKQKAEWQEEMTSVLEKGFKIYLWWWLTNYWPQSQLSEIFLSFIWGEKTQHWHKQKVRDCIFMATPIVWAYKDQ